MTMITPSYLGETIEYSSLHACRSTLEDPTDSMIETWWGRSLVASRPSRAAYAALKCACFCYLGVLLPLPQLQVTWLDANSRQWLSGGGQALVLATATFCVVRAIPVIWDGRRYLTNASSTATAAASLK